MNLPTSDFDADGPNSAMLTRHEWQQVSQRLNLTPRELEVCRHLFETRTRAQIAELLGVKPRTIRTHLEQIHEKLRVTSRVGVVLRIIQLRDWLRTCATSSDA